MDGLTRTIRLVVGLGMIGAGATLAAPAGLQLAAWRQAGGQTAARPGPLPPPAEHRAVAGLADGFAMPPAAARPAVEPRPVAAPPPPPPSPLPPVAGSGGVPDLQGTYRSTLDVPPPPLLDGQRPPPLAVGWTARPAAAGPSRQPPPRPAPPPPGRWRVRDGDDLNGIANRVYGTPQAATALWQANRGVLSDPQLLPIGVEIVLPPPAAIWPARRPQASIEPVAGRPASPSSQAAGPGPAWLPSAAAGPSDAG